MGQTWHAPAGVSPRPAAPNGPISSARSVPRRGTGAGLVMPWFATPTPWRRTSSRSVPNVDPGAHAGLIVDEAGWHLTPKLAIPDNITVLALPPRSPELNPVENVWQFMRDNWLSNRTLQILRRHRRAVLPSRWNNLIDQPWKLMSLGMRKWAHGVLINDRWYQCFGHGVRRG